MSILHLRLTLVLIKKIQSSLLIINLPLISFHVPSIHSLTDFILYIIGRNETYQIKGISHSQGRN